MTGKGISGLFKNTKGAREHQKQSEVEKFEKLESRIKFLELAKSKLSIRICSYEKDLSELRDELVEQKKKYAELLEKHITMMERMERLNGKREAD